MIERIVPATVVTDAVYGDQVWDAESVLFPAEAAGVATATEARRREFATVRMCARRALGGLGLPPVPLVRGRRGVPGWPAGVVGSLTHCPGYRAAAVATAQDVASLGIDAEPNMPLPEGVLAAIATAAELRRVLGLGTRSPEVCWDRLLFSIKESVFKTWYPLTGRELEFQQAEITLDPAAGTFRARLLVPAPELDALAGGLHDGALPGCWLVRYGLILTSVVLPGASARPGQPLRGGAGTGCSDRASAAPGGGTSPLGSEPAKVAVLAHDTAGLV
ncbi:4'-phosphopantetheinyl transferase superfamily protein [Streptomyces sp. NPDC007883]|uniref:4'-phosphopantetheinyl transferase family protein n=1 Tax=Streptomyces sp. NPDC007883 TaxID=3155116 RepID=UPI0033C68B16